MSDDMTDAIATGSGGHTDPAIDPELDLTLERVIRAPREAVFRAWTDPERFAQWFLPAPMRLRVERFEPIAGGALVTSMSDDGETWMPHLDALFLRVDAGERIVFTNAISADLRPQDAEPVPMAAEILLAAHAEGTDFRVIVRHRAPADRDRHAELGFAEGWGTVTAQLAALVEG